MNTIWKFKLEITDSQIIYVPKNAMILQTAQIQERIPVIWVLCDSSIKEMDEVVIMTFGTGRPIPGQIEKLLYIGTYQLGTFVGHVFTVRK